MDGAMGTELRRAGIGEKECHEFWNQAHSDKVAAIHRAYASAGSQVLLTNTFLLLRNYDPREPTRIGRTVHLGQEAVRIARSACGPEGIVVVTLGPLLEESSVHSLREHASLAKVIRSLACGEALLLETCSTLKVADAIDFLRESTADQAIPILLSLAFHRDAAGHHRTISGDSPECFAQELAVDALGVNCGRDIGMEEIIEIVRRYRQETDLPLFARPNAGTPTRAGNEWIYPLTPEMMAARLPELLEAGVSMVGGCCGTTPAHIAAMRPIIENWNARHA
jgi:5-methyltetrahydrofolate--homocysteine methyltransferase